MWSLHSHSNPVAGCAVAAAGRILAVLQTVRAARARVGRSDSRVRVLLSSVGLPRAAVHGVHTIELVHNSSIYYHFETRLFFSFRSCSLEPESFVLCSCEKRTGLILSITFLFDQPAVKLGSRRTVGALVSGLAGVLTLQ